MQILGDYNFQKYLNLNWDFLNLKYTYLYIHEECSVKDCRDLYTVCVWYLKQFILFLM